jgi:DHA1 family bicyclomycin/chloramphenicol resistance-like MFS transporter
MNQGPGYREFVTLLAFMISITALSIDMMLPAFTQIGKGLHVINPAIIVTNYAA